jgi:hypothetical protein
MKNWTDDKFLEYLMTSDFDDNLSPEDYKLLLQKFRKFYRITAGRSTNIEMEKKKFDYEIDLLKTKNLQDISNLEQEKNHILGVYNNLLQRKLTVSERIIGKVKPKPNEIL